MADNDHEQSDRQLDAALSKYAAAEPRAGLEERILANLRTKQKLVPGYAWWRWSVAVALAAVVAALTVGWRLQKTSAPLGVKYPSTFAPSNGQRTEVTSNGKTLPAQVSKRATSIRTPRRTAIAPVNPKLDQFPSPQPLTEQEKILAMYTTQFHAQAVLIARVANEELQRDRAEVIDKPQSPAISGDQETTNR